MNRIKEDEVFKDIPGYEGRYQVSNYGRVWSLIRGREMSYDLGKEGYLRCSLCHYGQRNIPIGVSRLVAITFLDKPNENQIEVNHKDENKQNNHVDNLEWVSKSENINHGTRNKRVAEKLNIKVLQLDLQGNLIKEWDSIGEASKSLGIHRSTISRHCNNHITGTIRGGYIWRYANGEDYEKENL